MHMKEFGFIGAGKMASAIVKGMLHSGAATPADIVCTCGADSTGAELARATNITTAASVGEMLQNAKVVVAACKPQQLSEAALDGANAKCKILVSILAGTSIGRLRQCFPNVGKIVRVMPNMPAQISQGISCYAPEKPLEKDETSIVEKILGAIGEFMEIPEAQLDAVTALSGSGPGYIFEFAAALIEGGVKLGFTPEQAKKLTYKTILGSAMLLEKSPLNADDLRIAVSSKGGTTLAALDVFAKSGFRKTVADALVAAKVRSEELSKL